MRAPTYLLCSLLALGSACAHVAPVSAPPEMADPPRSPGVPPSDADPVRPEPGSPGEQVLEDDLLHFEPFSPASEVSEDDPLRLEPFDPRWEPMPRELVEEREPRRGKDRDRASSATTAPAHTTGDGAVEVQTSKRGDVEAGAAKTGSGGAQLQTEDAVPPPGAPVSARVAWAWRAFYDHAVDAALAEFLHLVQEAPERADIRYGGGRCFLARGALGDARAWFEQAVTLDPADPEARFYLGAIAYQEEDFREAIAVWELAAPLLEPRPPGPLHRDYAWLLARAYLEVGDLERGRHWYDRALALGGRGPKGALYPPALELEYTASGRLPGERFMPVGGRTRQDLGAGLLFSSGGAIWKLEGVSPLRERISSPPPGWRDGHPSPAPSGRRLAYISTDAEGLSWLMMQGDEGHRERIVPTPVVPIQPAWSQDGNVIAFVALDIAARVPRVQLLQVSSGDVRIVDWPPGESLDPDFGPDGSLILAFRSVDGYMLGRTGLGRTDGEILYSRLPRTVAPRGEDGTSTAIGVQSRREVGPRRRAPGASRPLNVPDPWVVTGTGDEASDGARVDGAQATSRPSSGGIARAQLKSAGSTPESEDRPLAVTAVPPMDRRSGAAARPAEEPLAATGAGETARAGEPELRDPVAQPGGRQDLIAYSRQAAGRRRIWVREPSEGIEVPISPTDRDCTAPGFSPDGRTLVYMCVEDGLGRLYLYDLDEKREEPLYAEALSANSPVWLSRTLFPVRAARN